MSEIKGYVVRGKSALGLDVFCDSMGGHTGRLGVPAQVMQMPDRAAGERVRMLDRGCVDVRVYAVTEDGIEAPLPTYAAALDEVGQLCAEVNLARGRTMAALAEAERLRGEVDTMRGQRDAFRDHLDLAYRNAYTERAAWARLVRAEQVHHAQTVLLGERDDDAKGAYAEVVAARQALCDLGVDVGSQLGEGPAS